MASLIENVKKYWWAFAALIVLTIVIIFFTSCGLAKEITRSEWDQEVIHHFNGLGIANEYTGFRHTQRTPQGARVKSVVQVPADFLTAVDEGLQRQIDRFATMFPNWTTVRPISDHTILVIHPNPTYSSEGVASPPCVTEVNEPGAPCIYVRGIRAAATILGYDDNWTEIDQTPPIVLPHQETQGWRYRDYWVNSIHNEAEHRAGWLNRWNEPTGLFYHFQGANDVHPWQWGEMKSLVSPVRHTCGIEAKK